MTLWIYFKNPGISPITFSRVLFKKKTWRPSLKNCGRSSSMFDIFWISSVLFKYLFWMSHILFLICFSFFGDMSFISEIQFYFLDTRVKFISLIKELLFYQVSKVQKLLLALATINLEIFEYLVANLSKNRMFVFVY